MPLLQLPVCRLHLFALGAGLRSAPAASPYLLQCRFSLQLKMAQRSPVAVCGVVSGTGPSRAPRGRVAPPRPRLLQLRHLGLEESNLLGSPPPVAGGGEHTSHRHFVAQLPCQGLESKLQLLCVKHARHARTFLSLWISPRAPPSGSGGAVLASGSRWPLLSAGVPSDGTIPCAISITWAWRRAESRLACPTSLSKDWICALDVSLLCAFDSSSEMCCVSFFVRACSPPSCAVSSRFFLERS